MTKVFLYELAVELGEHSNDLVDVAKMMGVADPGPATELDANQVAQLRAHFGGMPAGPPPPPLPPSAAGLPPAPGPVPGPAPGSGPVAPASWGPPAPPSFQSAPGPPPGSLPPQPGGPVATEPGGDERRWTTAQLAAVIGVAVLVAGLFGFMVLNTGPDEERLEALEAREQELAANTTEWIPPETTTTSEAPMVTAAPMPRAAPRGLSGVVEVDPDDKPPAPTDLTRFCSGARSVMIMENAVATAFLSADIAALQAALANERRDWDVGVEHVLAGASERDRPLIEQYRANYLDMFAAIERATSTQEVTDFLQANYTEAEIAVADPVNVTIASYC